MNEKSNMKLPLHFIKCWLPVIIVLGVIFWLSGNDFTSGRTSEFFFPIIKSLFPQLSSKNVTFVHELIRASAHIVEYFILGLLLSFAFTRSHMRLFRFKKPIMILILITLLALSDELHQFFVSSRKASLIDVCLDLSGGFLSQIIFNPKFKVLPQANDEK